MLTKTRPPTISLWIAAMLCKKCHALVGLALLVIAAPLHADTFTSCRDVTQIPEAQCNTLVALYDNTAGANWKNNTGWKQTNTPCSWHGISCANGGITRIDLRENNVIGTLPPFSALTNLTYIRLESNQLSGSIPDLSALTSLTHLYLNSNQLSGTLPDLSALTNLTYIVLGHNKLSGSLPELRTLTRLTRLYLHDNQLSGSIPDLSALTSLTHLYLHTNKLTGSIPDLSALTSLRYVYLYNNKLSGTIPELSALTSLRVLYLHNNQLSGSIPDLSALTNLTYIRLEYNQLSGSIPDLSALTSLTHLYLHTNKLTGSIPDLSALTSLTYIRLEYNQLSGSIPDLSALTNLTYIRLEYNQLSGSIPDLSALTSLTHLYLYSNKLSGSIPDLSALTNLTHLILHTNQLTGSIPDLSALTSLRYVYLYNNQLSGTIPELSTLTNLQKLWLLNNHHTGPIPDLSNLKYLTELRLPNNQLSGAIPALDGLTNLSLLELAGNPSLCKDANTSYGNWTEVDEFPVCVGAQVKLMAEATATPACVGQNVAITVKKQQPQTVDGIQLAMSFDPNTLQIKGITNSGTLSAVLQNEHNNTDGTLRFAAGNFFNNAVSGEFEFTTISLIPLAASTGTELQFDPNNTVVTFKGTKLSHEADNLTLVIDNCAPPQKTLPPPLPPNSSTATAAGQVGSQGDAGDGGPATAAQFNTPKGMLTDSVGNIYVADTQNHRIRKIDSQRNITTIAGNGNPGYSGDDGPATQAKLNSPMDVALDSTGQYLYIADRNNARIRKLDLTTGIITTVAGTNRKGYSGDNGPATAAKLQSPVAVVLDQHNNIYIADTGRHIVRKVDNSTGLISTIAGKGYRGARGDNGPATNALLNQPSGLAVDKQGNLYIADMGNNRIRKIDNTGTISTVAGDTNAGYHGDGGPATAAKLNGPTDVTIDNAGNLYIADNNNHVIRKVDTDGKITTLVGNGNAGYTNDGTLATITKLYNPSSVALDNNGNLLISDTNNHLIRQVGTATEDSPVTPNESTTDCNAVTEIPSAECFALLALNQSTSGDNWNNQEGWNTTNTPCSWNGVSCTNGHVTGINLNSNNLVGPLPDLSALSELSTLNLSHNQLSGAMAPITALPKLQTALLEHNNLQGVIPDLSGLTQLQTLALTGNAQLCRDTNLNDGPINLDDVEACPTENILPTAAFTATPTAGQAPLTVQLDGSASTDPYGTITNYHWTISDGRTFTGVSPTITFDNSGDYEITLTVYDNEDYQSLNDPKKTITVTAAADKFPLILAKDGEGKGTLTVRQTGALSMICRTDCPQKGLDYPIGSELQLIANAAKGSTFTGWNGDCVNTERRHKLTMDGPKVCTAQFQLDVPAPSGLYTLSVNTVGTFGGTGTIEIGDENCGSECVGNYRPNQRIKLTAVPQPHAYFAGWSRDCKTEAQNPTITVTMTADKHCAAVFGNDADKIADQMTEEFQQEGELSTGEELTEVYPPNLNEERLLEAYRLAEKAMLMVEEHFIVTQTWPAQFHGFEWYAPLPDSFYTKSIQIIAGGTEIELESETVFVAGDYIKVEVEQLTNTGVEEILPILVYYDEVPKITESNLRRRRSPRIGRYKRCRRHHRRHCR
jgi:Leucine-rich repeat (LRR) protein/PKD repeat protein